MYATSETKARICLDSSKPIPLSMGLARRPGTPISAANTQTVPRLSAPALWLGRLIAGNNSSTYHALQVAFSRQFTTQFLVSCFLLVVEEPRLRIVVEPFRFGADAGRG